MNLVDRVNFTIATYGRLFVGLFHFRLWPPFLLYMVLMLLLVWAVAGMYSPLVSGVMVPLATWLTDENVQHYPQHLGLVPYVFERLRIVASLLVESVLIGAACIMFAAWWRREKEGFAGAFRRAMKKYPQVVLIWLVNFVLIYLLFEFLPGLFADFVRGSPRRQIALFVGLYGLSVLLTSLFIYVFPYLLLRGKGLLASFTSGFALFFRNFFTTIFLVGLPQLFILPLIYSLQNTGRIIEKFTPELVVWLTALLAVGLTFVNFFTTGAVIRYFQQVAED